MKKVGPLFLTTSQEEKPVGGPSDTRFKSCEMPNRLPPLGSMVKKLSNCWVKKHLVRNLG